MAKCPELAQAGAVVFSYRDAEDQTEVVCSCPCTKCLALVTKHGFKPIAKMTELEKRLLAPAELLAPEAERVLAKIASHTAVGMIAKCLVHGASLARFENEPPN